MQDKFGNKQHIKVHCKVMMWGENHHGVCCYEPWGCIIIHCLYFNREQAQNVISSLS